MEGNIVSACFTVTASSEAFSKKMLRPKVLFFEGKRCEPSNIYSVINSDGQSSKDGFLGECIRGGYSPN